MEVRINGTKLNTGDPSLTGNIFQQLLGGAFEANETERFFAFLENIRRNIGSTVHLGDRMELIVAGKVRLKGLVGSKTRFELGTMDLFGNKGTV